MDKELDNLIAFITEHYPFEPANFPVLENVSDEEKLQFAVRHLCLHFAKTTGKLVAAVEPADHGGEIDREALEEEVVKQLITTLRLAELMGVKGEDIIRDIEGKCGANISLEK